MALEQLQFLEEQIGKLDQETASLLRQHQDAVERLAEVPGLEWISDPDHAEVGPTAATFPRGKHLSSWWAPAPATKRAGVNYSHRSPQGKPPHASSTQSGRERRRKGQRSIFEIVFRRSVPRLGHNQAHRGHCPSTVSVDLVDPAPGVRYEEHGPSVTKQSRQARTARMIRQLRQLGYRIELPNSQSLTRQERDFDPARHTRKMARRLTPPGRLEILFASFRFLRR